MIDTTIQYYDRNAERFADLTINANMKAHHDFFLQYIPKSGNVLDLGCGSGRDSKKFIELGYSVTAVDGSEELCKIASKITGLNVRCLLFKDLDYFEQFDGVWASASLLHIYKYELQNIFFRIHKAIKPGGILYASFKYGDFEGERNGRYFVDLNEKLFNEVIAGIPNFKIQDIRVSYDTRPEHENELWLNAIVMKTASI